MAFYDEIKAALLEKARERHGAAARNFAQAKLLCATLGRLIGGPSGALKLVTHCGSDASDPPEFAPDKWRCARFYLQLTAYEEAEALATYRLEVSFGPGLPGELAVCVDGVRVKEKVESLEEEAVVLLILTMLSEGIMKEEVTMLPARKHGAGYDAR